MRLSSTQNSWRCATNRIRCPSGSHTGQLPQSSTFSYRFVASEYTAIPWLVATVTDLVIGGWLIDYLIRRGNDETLVRKTVLVTGMLLGLAVFGAAFTARPALAIVWISIALAGLGAAAPVGWSIPSLIAPKGGAATVGGIMNFVNNLMGAVAPIVTGFIVGITGSFNGAFLVAGVALLIGIFAYLVLLGRIEPIPDLAGPPDIPAISGSSVS